VVAVALEKYLSFGGGGENMSVWYTGTHLRLSSDHFCRSFVAFALTLIGCVALSSQSLRVGGSSCAGSI